MTEFKYGRWTNLRVCKVEEAGILWVRELPSNTCSEELQSFLKLEMQINEHFKNKQLQDSQHYSLLRVGSHIVVYHQGFWARGWVESVPETRMEKAKVFLCDYGCTINEQVRNIVLLNHGEWTSVPYQAKRICLAGVAPVSLQYSLPHEEVKLVLKKFKHWDPASTRFVESLIEEAPKVDFEPVALNHDGSVSGKLAVGLPRECWTTFVSQLRASVLPETAKDWITLDLALVLVAEGYAVLQAKGENMQTEQGCLIEQITRLGGESLPQLFKHCKLDTWNVPGVLAESYILPRDRHMVSTAREEDSTFNNEESKSSLAESDLSRCNRRPPSSLFLGSTESIPKNIDMSSLSCPCHNICYARGEVWDDDDCDCCRCKNVTSSKVISAVPGESKKADGGGAESLSISSSSFDAEGIAQHPYTRKRPKNTSVEDACFVHWKSHGHLSMPLNISEESSFVHLPRSKLENKPCIQERCSSTVTSIHFTENLLESTVPGNYGNHAPPRSQQGSLTTSLYGFEKASAAKGKAQEKISYLCESSWNAKSKGKICGYHGSLRNTVVISNLSDEESHASFDTCTENNNLMLSSKSHYRGYPGSSNIPEEIHLKPLHYMNDFVPDSEIKPLGDTHLFQEFDVSGPIATNNLIDGSGHEKKDMSGKSHLWEYPVNIETKHEPFYTSLLLVDKGSEMDQCSSAPYEGFYRSLTLQHAHPEAPNITKLYRVFITGEYHISDEEVITNKDMMLPFLNDHIVSALLKRGLNATRLQAYTWPVIAKGSSVAIVGEKSSGKTMGYVVPLLSNILDTWELISKRLPPGIGPVMVVVCSTWQSAKCVADYVVTLLPASTPFKIMTAWGGCGHEEEVSTSKQLLSGCDILITTAPCLLRLLRSGSQGPTTTLKRCCHLVFDDIEVTLQHFPTEVKQIITMLGEGRRKCGRTDLELQVVLVSTRWTELVCQLTKILFPLLEPTLVISAPCEAAIATKVASHMHLVSNETEALHMVMKLMESYVHKKKMVFVSNDNLAELLSELINDAGMLCVTVSNTTHMWKIRKFVQEWHAVEGMTMIVNHGAEVSLLYHDIANAQVLFHTHLGPSLTTFTHRYSFMLSNFVTDLNQKSTNCESHLILTKYALEKLPGALNELYRICESVPSEVKDSVASLQDGRNSKNRALCYYLKAYGRCYNKFACNFRHVVKISDIPKNIPRLGEVTIKVIRTLTASRYLVHLVQYREEAGAQCIDLSNTYPALCTALQNHFLDPGQCEPLRCAEPGMLCAVQDNGAWGRAQIISVNQGASTSMINVFFIDEGKQVTVSLESARVLPFHLATVPQLVVEVLLCHIQPMDGDHSWTLQATHFVRTIFAQKKDSKFIGRIVLALGFTLWLNPVAEFIRIGKTFVQKKAMREKLLSEKFGVNNPTHIKNLEELCSQADVSLQAEAVCDRGWRMTVMEALMKLKVVESKEDPHRSGVTDTCVGCEGLSSEGTKEKEQLTIRKGFQSETNIHSHTSIGEASPPQHKGEQVAFGKVPDCWTKVLSNTCQESEALHQEMTE